MSKINGFQNRPGQIGSGKVSAGKPVERTSTPNSDATSTTTAVSNVNVSDQARQLAALEQAVQALPAVNEARVAQIRRSIEDGSYQVAPDRIADKLMSLEHALNA